MEISHGVGAAGARAPLGNFPLFSTFDLDEARARVSRVFCEHSLNVVGRSGRLGAEMYYRPLRGIGIGRMRYGASVSVDAGQLGDFALIQMPLSGAETIEHGGQTVLSDPSCASVLSPGRSLRFRHDESTEKLFIRIDREALERHCRQHLGGDLRQPVVFDAAMHLQAPRAQAWIRLLNWLCQEISEDDASGAGMLQSPIYAAQIEQTVLTTLLLCQPHNYSVRLADDTPMVAPSYVRKVERFIDDHADEPITIGDLAECAAVSTRSLFAGFRKFRNTTPMQYLKDVRLRRVREALMSASPESITVTAVAMRWGFTHLGHFTADYKRSFGESPSVTLAR